MTWNTDLAEQTFTEDLYRIKGKVIILIPVRWEELPQAETDLLAKILESVQLSLAKVQVISAVNADVSAFAATEPAFIFSFGVAIKGIEEKYSITEQGGVKVMLADDLRNFDKHLKEKLWQELKRGFLS